MIAALLWRFAHDNYAGMKRLLRWALYLLIVVVVLVAAGLFFLDRIVKGAMQRAIHSQTGLDVKIEKVVIGVATPTVTIEGLTLYNTAEFGGTPMLIMPELHLEYDLKAISSHNLHLKLVRLNISEIDAVKDKKGRLNFQALQDNNRASLAEAKSRSAGFAFTGIDTLNLTLGKLRIFNADSPNREQEISFGIENQIFHNIKSEADLGGIGVILAARNAFALPSTSTHAAQKLLQELTGKKQKPPP
jgi:uncharacterized protein involved in outer membrane biogenesis